MKVLRDKEQHAGNKQQLNSLKSTVDAQAEREEKRICQIKAKLVVLEEKARRKALRAQNREHRRMQHRSALTIQAAWYFRQQRIRHSAGLKLRHAILIAKCLFVVRASMKKRREERLCSSWLRLRRNYADRAYHDRRAACAKLLHRAHAIKAASENLALQATALGRDTFQRKVSVRREASWVAKVRALRRRRAACTVQKFWLVRYSPEHNAKAVRMAIPAFEEGRMASRLRSHFTAIKHCRIQHLDEESSCSQSTNSRGYNLPRMVVMGGPETLHTPRTVLDAQLQIRRMAIALHRQYAIRKRTVFGWARAQARMQLKKKREGAIKRGPRLVSADPSASMNRISWLRSYSRSKRDIRGHSQQADKDPEDDRFESIPPSSDFDDDFDALEDEGALANMLFV